MNNWTGSFLVECPNDTDPSKSDDHVAAEVRAPVDLRTLGALGKLFKRCTCGAGLRLRGQGTAAGTVAK